MKLLKTIPTNRVVGIDVETVRIEKEFESLSDDYQSAWEYKNKQDGEIPEQEELKDFWEKRSSLYAEFSKVCAVSLTYLDNNDNLTCKEFYGENEKELLESLGIVLNNMVAVSSDYRLAGHASKYFDYPFLCKRFVINSLDIPIVLDSLHLKPWEQKNLCTNELWRMGGTGPGSSLQALCTALQIPISKVDLVGDEVGKAYYNSEYERIGRYCSYDTIATFNIIRKLKKEPIFDFNNVNYILAYNGLEDLKEEVEEKPLLERIYDNKEISSKDKKELKEVLSKDRVTAKDKKNIFTILRGLMVRTDFENKDQTSKKQIKLIEEELNEFIKTL
jgi:hypothetical protein